MLKKNNVLFFILSIFLSILLVFSGVSPILVSADNSVAGIEKTNVLDDLKDMTIDGKKFSLEEYNFDTKKDTQILSFVEYCYSFYEEKQNDFGLYIYVYNPKGLKFDTTSTLNTIQFATTKETDSAYSKYTLTFLNMSEETNYEGLFYKFKVNLSDAQKTAILNGVNSTSRVYKVSGFELLTQGDTNATDYTIAYTFSFSGYAKGYGPNESSASTLTCLKECLNTLSLDVHPTTYRPDGTNGKNEYTRDSLHSVYFSVPNDIIAEYGEMTAVHATWLNAVIKPALVTGNQNAYNVLINYLGSSLDSNCNYGYISDYYSDLGQGDMIRHFGYFSYLPSDFWLADAESYDCNLDTISLLFNSGSSENSADNYIVSSDDILFNLKESAEIFGGNLVNNKYSEYMFESVDEIFIDKTIYASEDFSLNSYKQVIGDGWWEKLWGLTVSKDYSSAFNGIQAIYPVKDSDIYGSITEVSNKLYISQADVDDFRNYYNANKELSTIYLFRYQVSDFISSEGTLFKSKDTLGYESWSKVDTNAYFFQETVNLDFDVIDITFSTGDVETVIPVVSNPVDNVGEGEPPIDTKSDKKSGCNIEDFKMFLRIIALFFILWIFSVTGFLRLLIKLVVFVVTAPFKFIAWIVRKIKEKR